jgi:hypothetical protein
MNNSLPLQEDKKLSVTYRVEAGCLGPEGLNHITDFCKFAETEFQTVNSDYISWKIVHREDKTLPEMEYNVFGKMVTEKQAEKYLAVFGLNLDEFEGNLSDNLTTLVNQFMKGKLPPVSE